MSVSIGLSLLLTLAGQCAPTVHPETLAAIVRTESGGNPLKIHINGAPQPSPEPVNQEEVISLARQAIQEGNSVDLGLMQINSNNLEWLGMSIEDTFDPCKNMAAGARILQENYERAMRDFEEGQPALQVALSAYNTGNQSAGFKNGYVDKVLKNTDYKVPALTAPKPETPPDWDVFGGEEQLGSSWDAFSEEEK